MKKIFVVFGQTGEYDDYMDWAVKAFRSRRRASALATKAKKRADEIQVAEGGGHICFTDIKNEYDPLCQIDFCGTKYTVASLTLDDRK